MLVLSRRPNEKIYLPTIPAVIQVISSQPNLVRLGIEAPDDVPILREELCGAEGTPAVPAGARHLLRNRLNNMILGMALLRLQLGEVTDPAVGKTLAGLEEELQALSRSVAPPAPAPSDGQPQPSLAAPVGP
jgi:carbon storage regulator CsrA